MKIVNQAKKDKLQAKLLENKVISMTKIKKLLNLISTSDLNKKRIDKKTCNMYQEILNDSIALINTINNTGITETR